MARWLGNPFAFTPLPVTIITSAVYIALAAALLVVHLVVPSAPDNHNPVAGVNLTEAWRDLQFISNGFHPYNSRRNDEVRDWLLRRIEAILDRNRVRYGTESSGTADEAPVVIYNDMVSNVTFSGGSTTSIYFEGTNIMVYIRGSDDVSDVYSSSTGGVLVNAHYDSVSTGYGATDDGVGVITILQLISHFTTPGHRPRRGIVALLNNGEEDWLNGAKAFTQHPLSGFPHTFLNLEGAGAGGRATLFRSTDTEVTRFYKKSNHPFGTAISADGFKRGVIRSGTDYSVFTEDLALRGLDVAFMEPRAQYHTVEDGARDTSLDSLWHMLSGALDTMKGLTSYTGSEFEGGDHNTGEGTTAVYFDLFGSALAVFRLHTLFALSVALLVASPVILIALNVALVKADKWYLFARKKYLHSPDDDEAVQLYGWRGFFRVPIAFVVATGAVIGLAFLVAKVNPNIVYSSEYAVWSMMLTAWITIAWFFLRGGNAMRPSALSRAHGFLWMYIGAYILLVGGTIAERHFQIAGTYFLVIYFAAIFVALLISYVELFALPKKQVFVQQFIDSQYSGTRTPASLRRSMTPTSSRPLTAVTGVNLSSEPLPKLRDEIRANDDDSVTETTSLLRSDRPTTFARYGSRRTSMDAHSALSVGGRNASGPPAPPRPYDKEQPWSGYLPSWTWLLQFLLVAPINIILIGQIGLIITSALHQTLADGSSAILVYIMIAVFTVLLLLPMVPFLHRFSLQIPTFLFMICVGTLIYNLVAFPFSPNNKLKVYFIQRVDLDTGLNEVSLTGLDGYVQNIVSQLPSAANQEIKCGEPDMASRAGLTKCAWRGLAPAVVPRDDSALPPDERGYLDSWITLNATRNDTHARATFEISGRDTRSCRLFFDAPIKDFSVRGASTSRQFPHVGEDGTTEIRLWSRDWERPWEVEVKWEGDGGMDGRAVCIWSDANDKGRIPALDEVRMEMGDWAIVSKLSDGLVEGVRAFAV
ncbi:uncharacterized protein K452DRAFT_232243 [Aplosporella prunicola CBS 121167]|uniref:Peptide hydrolase n=1 Tax=Aplosporella prunicola CBS 121167 TaxID=1176127 RepID=A0A6A6B6T2_9PEZI|nr:uncharacterized protein K452DRAFT_232243 [Aplosporella prunicola CBS 121167]KAF2139720.1 hypothetical protein K452DRAFT_232243 [Aplosporella prunicola CBS 121167]